MADAEVSDRFGLTWQPALAAGILSNLDRIDVIEVIAEEQFGASVTGNACARDARASGAAPRARRRARPGVNGTG